MHSAGAHETDSASATGFDRVRNLERLERETFDVLVIGGGATGAGVALDAATRGLKVALVERADFASGTSSRSTKLVHGGVRYLQAAITRLDRAQFHLVQEGLAERAILLNIAPHLVHSLRLVVPARSWYDAITQRFGLWLYDRIAGRSALEPSRWLSASEVLASFPKLRRRGLRGGVAYHDGQFDDARMVMAVLATAAEASAVIANRVEVSALIERDARLAGAQVRDASTDRSFTIHARSLVNATGPQCDAVRRLEDPQADALLATSRGSHLALEAHWAPRGDGLLIPHTRDDRVLFLLPWQGASLLGTTDEAAEPVDDPTPQPQEEAYLLAHAGEWFEPAPQASDVRARWAGLRPLVAGRARNTARLVRDHYVEIGPKGLVSIAGGKWTTYRRMAEVTVDALVETAQLKVERTCQTRTLKLLGARSFHPQLASELARTHALESDIAAHLAASYGDRAEAVLAHGGPSHRQRLLPQHPFIEAEVLWARDREMALSAEDVLARRLRLAFTDAVAARALTPHVQALLDRSRPP